MSFEFIVLVCVMAMGFIMLFWFVRRSGAHEKPQDQSGLFLMLQNQVNAMGRTLDERLGESSRLLQSQYGTTARITQEVTEKLTRLEETNKQVMSFADQLRSLEDILKNPKQRGILGEYYLETLLKNVFPPGMYQMQYAFADGEIVDAVIFMKDKMITIDSKFSLENYNRLREAKDPVERERLQKVFKQDLKNRIDETAKYVRPEEGTMDFAFMFIPAEGIYYDLLVNEVGVVNARDLIEYAFLEKKVHIVSPTTLLSHLKMVMHGLRMLQIEDSAKEIRKRVEELGAHLKNYEIFMQKLGATLGTTVNHYNSAYKELGKVDKDVLHIAGAKAGIEVAAVQGPEKEIE